MLGLTSLLGCSPALNPLRSLSGLIRGELAPLGRASANAGQLAAVRRREPTSGAPDYRAI